MEVRRNSADYLRQAELSQPNLRSPAGGPGEAAGGGAASRAAMCRHRCADIPIWPTRTEVGGILPPRLIQINDRAGDSL